MTIEPLSAHRHLIASIASTLHAAWGELPPWSDPQDIRARLEAGASSQAIPHTVVITDGHANLAATGSVKLHELPRHPDKEHWIGEIFVLPAFRGRGMGSTLTTHLSEYAFAHGAARLHLYTPDQQALYRRLGWYEVATDTVHGESVSVMALTP